jgi:hypothetical protein
MQAMRVPAILLSCVVCLASSALAGPSDGPILKADVIVIQGNINGSITNGRQGSTKEVCFIWCVTSHTSTTSGLLNVNGIVQQGHSVISARQIILQNDLNHDINNQEGTLNYKGIMQIAR